MERNGVEQSGAEHIEQSMDTCATASIKSSVMFMALASATKILSVTFSVSLHRTLIHVRSFAWELEIKWLALFAIAYSAVATVESLIWNRVENSIDETEIVFATLCVDCFDITGALAPEIEREREIDVSAKLMQWKGRTRLKMYQCHMNIKAETVMIVKRKTRLFALCLSHTQSVVLHSFGALHVCLDFVSIDAIE